MCRVNAMNKKSQYVHFPPQYRKLNLMYMKRSEDVSGIFWTPGVCSIYEKGLGGGGG